MTSNPTTLLKHYVDNYGKVNGTKLDPQTYALVNSLRSSHSASLDNLKEAIQLNEAIGETSQFMRDSKQLMSVLDGQIMSVTDLTILLRKIAEEFVGLHTEREVLYLRSELVSVLDRCLTDRFPCHDSTAKQIGVDRFTLPEFLAGEMTLLRSRTGLAVNASTNAGALYLAHEFLNLGRVWLSEDCEPLKYKSGDENDDKVGEFTKLHEKLLGSFKRHSKLSNQNKIDVLDDLVSLQHVMTTRCGDEANLFFPDFVVSKEDRATLQMVLESAAKQFGSYDTFLDRCQAAKAMRNTVAHANAYRTLTCAQLKDKLSSDPDALRLLELARTVTNSDQPLLSALRRCPSSSADGATSTAREHKWILMSRAERVDEMVSRWHSVPAI